MMCYNFGNQKVIFLQGMGDGIGHEKNPENQRITTPMKKNTNALF